MNKTIKSQLPSNTRGITLIALIITIIILLILASISIATLTGENGLLNKALLSQEQTKYSHAEEKVKLAVMASYNTNNQLDNSMLKENLNAIDGISTKVEEIFFNLPITVDGYNFAITKSGNIKSEQKGELLKPTITHEITPEAGTNASSVTIKIIAQYGNSGIQSIQKPDGSIENSDTVTYTVTENGNYDFLIKDIDANETIYTVTITNVTQKLYLYNRGISYRGTFIGSHSGNGSGNVINGDAYLEISTRGQTGYGGQHNAISTENIGVTGFKNLHVVYDVVSTTFNGSHNDCRRTIFGTTKIQNWSTSAPKVGSYSDTISLESDSEYENSQLKFSVKSDWTDESLTVRIYEVYLTN